MDLLLNFALHIVQTLTPMKYKLFLTLLFIMPLVGFTQPIANDDFFHIRWHDDASLPVLTNDSLSVNETYEFSVILNYQNPFIHINTDYPNINVEINEDSLLYDYGGLSGWLTPDSLEIYCGDGSPDYMCTNGGSGNYNYHFKYILCDSNMSCDTADVTISIIIAEWLSTDEENIHLKIYPNPVDNFLFISNENYFIESISIYDSTSKQLNYSNINNNNTLIKQDISYLKPGLYYALLIVDNNRQVIKKLYKR